MQPNQKNITIPISESKLRIKRDSLAKQDIPSWFVFCYHLSPNIFKNKFRQYGVIINNEADLATLVRLAISGGDKSGVIKDEKGNPLVFDAVKIVNGIEMNLTDIQQSLRDKFIIED